MLHEIHSSSAPAYIPQSAPTPRTESAESEAPQDRFSPVEESRPRKKWNVLYYMAGNNSIAEDMLKKIARMETTGSDDNVNVLVQVGRPSNAQYLPGGYRFYIERHDGKNNIEFPSSVVPFKLLDTVSRKKARVVDSKPLQELGPVDMSDPGVFSDFVTWGMKTYPAEHTLVVIMDHGYGFLGTSDDNAVKHTMSLNQIEQALEKVQEETGKKVDVLGLDSCLMAQAEVAEQLKDSAQYLVASEEIEYPLGWPEGSIIKELKNRASSEYVSPKEFTRIIIDECAKNPESMKTASSVKLDGMDAVTQKAGSLAESLMSLVKDNPEAKAALRGTIKKTHNYCLIIPGETLCQDYRDLIDLSQNILKDFKEPAVTKAARELIIAVEDAVIAETHKGEETEGSHGVSVYLPTTGFITSYKTETGALVNPQERYLDTRFAHETLWDELIEEIRENPPAPPQQ